MNFAVSPCMFEIKSACEIFIEITGKKGGKYNFKGSAKTIWGEKQWNRMMKEISRIEAIWGDLN